MSSIQRSSTRLKRLTAQDDPPKSYYYKKLNLNHAKDKIAPEVTGEVREPRRGIYYASELLHYRDSRTYFKENYDIENVCIIRFPDEIAAIIQSRLAEQLPNLEDIDASEVNSSKSSDLGVTITPTPDRDYRIFNVQVEKTLGVPSSIVNLIGVLVELPCLLETHKSLDGDLLFKANDISQMMYVYDPNSSETPFDFKQIQDTQLWEWHSGLTPGTHRIRHRRFKNFNVFDKADVIVAEREICNILNQRGTHQICYLEAVSEYSMEEHLSAISTGLEAGVQAVIGPENPLLYAAIHKLKPSAAMAKFDAENEDANLLFRKHAQKQMNDQNNVSERIKFCNKASLLINENDDIPSDLSDYLFDELQPVTDYEKEDAQLEEEIREFAYNTMDKNLDENNSDLSISSEENAQTRKERRHKTKNKSKNK